MRSGLFAGLAFLADVCFVFGWATTKPASELMGAYGSFVYAPDKMVWGRLVA